MTEHCLHCEIMDLVGRRTATDSDNELLFKIIEAAAEIIAAAPTRNHRRQFIKACHDQLCEMVPQKLEERVAEGLTPSRVVSTQ